MEIFKMLFLFAFFVYYIIQFVFNLIRLADFLVGVDSYRDKKEFLLSFIPFFSIIFFFVEKYKELNGDDNLYYYFIFKFFGKEETLLYQTNDISQAEKLDELIRKCNKGDLLKVDIIKKI